jgi:hypothetical protein
MIYQGKDDNISISWEITQKTDHFINLIVMQNDSTVSECIFF